jgi:DNA-binding response OmpR family regulator
MRGRVLIVDDDRALSTVVAEVLSEEGFVISECEIRTLPRSRLR